MKLRPIQDISWPLNHWNFLPVKQPPLCIMDKTAVLKHQSHKAIYKYRYTISDDLKMYLMYVSNEELGCVIITALQISQPNLPRMFH